MPLRILYVINTLARGGAERIAIDICRELQRRNDHRYLLVSISPVNEYPELSLSINSAVSDAQVYLKFPFIIEGNVDEFNSIVQKFQPDVIHTHLFMADHVAHFLPRHEVAYFSHVHGPTSQYERMQWWQLFKKDKLVFSITRQHIFRIYRKVNHHFIANSVYTKQYLKKHLPKDLDQIIAIPNAIDLSKFPFAERTISQPVRIITTGSLIRRKNHTFLLDVMNAMKEKKISITLEILGDGPLRERLIQET